MKPASNAVLQNESLEINSPYFMLPCECPVCCSYKPSTNTDMKEEMEASEYGKELMVGDYNWFLEVLASLERPLPGFQVPDSILWDEGKTTSVLKLQGNGRLHRFTKPNMPKDLARNIFEMKKGNSGLNVFAKVNCKHFSILAEPLSTVNELKDNYKAIMRTDSPSDAPFILLTQNGFSRIFTCWNKRRLRPILSIHRLIKLEKGYPEVIKVHYPVYKSKKKNSKRLYCEEVMKRTINLIKQVLDVSIKRLSMEFFVTDSEIWLNYAWDITYIEAEKKDELSEGKELAKYSHDYKLKKQDTLDRLSYYKKKLNMPKVNHIESLANAMNNRFAQIRNNTGINNIHTSIYGLPELHADFANVLLLPSLKSPGYLLRNGLASSPKLKQKQDMWREKFKSAKASKDNTFFMTIERSLHRPATARASNLLKTPGSKYLKPTLTKTSEWSKNTTASKLFTFFKNKTTRQSLGKSNIFTAKASHTSSNFRMNAT